MEARDTAATARPDGTIALQRPRFWSGRFARISTGFVLGAGIGALPALLGGGDERDLAVALQIASLLAGAYAVLAAARAVRISRHAPVIAFYPDHVVLPLTAESRRSATVAYRDVLSVASWGRGESQQVVIASKRRTFTYPHASFAHRDGPAMLQQTLLYRLATLPEGAELRQRFERRQAIAAATRERPIQATRTLLMLLAGVFLLQQALVPPDAPFGLVRLGANAPVLVREGQWFRLVSANFLHGSLLHIVLNGIGVLALGSLLERLLGPFRLLVIYLASALGGSAASAFLSGASFSVGASTAVFGLLGALAYTNYRYSGELPLGLRQPLRWWLFIFGINGALPFVVPQIDWAAHLGGLLLGVLCILFMLHRRSLDQAMAPAGRIVKLATAGLVTLFAAGIVAAGVRGLGAGERDEQRVLDAVLESNWGRDDLGTDASPR